MVNWKSVGLTALHFTAAVLCNVGGFLIFITVFFFTLGSWIEKLALQNQIHELVTASLTTMLWIVVPPDELNAIITAVNGTHIPDMTAEDQQVTDSNVALEKKSFAIMLSAGLGLLLVGMIFGAIHEVQLRKGVKGALKEAWQLFLMTLLMILSIFATELAFALLVSRYYQTVPPSWMNLQIIQIILNARKDG